MGRLRSGVRNKCKCRGIRAEYFIHACSIPNTGCKKSSKSRTLQAMMQRVDPPVFLLVLDKLFPKRLWKPWARSVAVANMSEMCSVEPPSEDSSASPSRGAVTMACRMRHALAVTPHA